MEISFSPLWLSFKLATITTCILLVLGIFIVYLIHFKLKGYWLISIVKSLVSLPLVLPPTVLGYYLLVAFNPDSLLGSFFEDFFNIQLVFSFAGILLGSVIFSLPFIVNPILSAVENLPTYYEDAAYTLGKTQWQTFTKVMLPNIKSSVIVGITMSFAHTIGEFGVILMIGGNIPDETRVASIAIYNEVEMLNYDSANVYSIILLIFSLSVLFFVNFFNSRKNNINL
ncbi:molybdate ABC transporter permease subunit [Chondrinema litorale]|uniref:molybdate ABC transporter permease subunit n=1 Tax=Chondrinema litorale TaxID=2994555 RepID=UPI00254475D6|nr:molybdate ABC transporter permease subunit [Chondrinema litorale]UZR94244.1 molybdate ABC transporter permease subunit [Chondrinema litorale]